MNCIYCRLYKLVEKTKTSSSFNFVACNLVFTILFFNVLTIALILEIQNIVKIFDIFSSTSLIAFGLFLLLLVHLYFNYKKRYLKIIEKYNLIKTSTYNSVLFWIYLIASLILPFILVYYIAIHNK
jgi:hypothetical protein